MDQEFLQALSDMLDAKLEEKLEAKLEEKLEAKLEEKFNAKLEPTTKGSIWDTPFINCV